MAAIVNHSVGQNGANDTTVASAALNVTAGNLIAVFAASQEGAGSTTIDSVSDTAGNTYVAGTAYGSGGGGALGRWFYAYDCLGNASNVATVTWSGNTRYKNCLQVQISGVDTSASVFSDESGGTVFSNTNIQPGSLSLTGDGIYLYGASSTNDRTWTPDGSYTELNDWGGSATVAYEIAASGSSNPTAVASGSSNLTIAAIAFLDAVAGGTAPSPNIPGRRIYVMP